jgi:protein arginine kinase activator
MLCDNCGKEPAKVHYKEMKGNQITEFHLCEKCALEKGIQIPHKKKAFSISDIPALMAEEVSIDIGTCKTCGLSYKEFRDTGRLGCSDCYESFKDQLKPLLRRIHGSNAHVGKSPRVSQENLKVELGRAIETEDFERAAEIRDRIKELETRPEDISGED